MSSSAKDSENTCGLAYTILPSEISNQVREPLAILSRRKLMYLDVDRGSVPGISRHARRHVRVNSSGPEASKPITFCRGDGLLRTRRDCAQPCMAEHFCVRGMGRLAPFSALSFGGCESAGFEGRSMPTPGSLIPGSKSCCGRNDTDLRGGLLILD